MGSGSTIASLAKNSRLLMRFSTSAAEGMVLPAVATEGVKNCSGRLQFPQLRHQRIDILLRIAKQHAGIFFVEERIVDTGVARSH